MPGGGIATAPGRRPGGPPVACEGALECRIHADTCHRVFFALHN
jgi:hypothetical protein